MVLQGGRLHPHVKNNWKIVFQFQDVNSFCEKMAERDARGESVPQVKDRYLNIAQVLSKMNDLPWEVSFSPPSLESEERTVRRQNISVKYGGFPSVGRASLEMFHWIESPVASFFVAWTQMVQGVSRTLEDDGLSFTRLRQIARVAPAIYKLNAYVQLEGQGQQGVRKGRWFLYGIFPHSIQMDDLDNTNDGDVQRPSLSFSIDYAKPASIEAEGSNFNATQIEADLLSSRRQESQEMDTSS